MHIFKLVPVAFLMVYASGCGCTEVGCAAALEINVSKTKSAWEPGTYVFTLDEDGKKGSCTVDLPFTKNPTCTKDELQLVLTIEAPGGTQADAVPTQMTSFTVSTKVTLAITRDGAEIATKDFAPTFIEHDPNGAMCGPTCQNASVGVTVP